MEQGPGTLTNASAAVHADRAVCYSLTAAAVRMEGFLALTLRGVRESSQVGHPLCMNCRAGQLMHKGCFHRAVSADRKARQLRLPESVAFEHGGMISLVPGWHNLVLLAGCLGNAFAADASTQFLHQDTSYEALARSVCRLHWPTGCAERIRRSTARLPSHGPRNRYVDVADHTGGAELVVHGGGLRHNQPLSGIHESGVAHRDAVAQTL